MADCHNIILLINACVAGKAHADAQTQQPLWWKVKHGEADDSLLSLDILC
jgi:hypothetical protein